MTVLMTSDMPGVTREGYDQLVAALSDVLVSSPGFISHGAGPVDGGFRVVELWESRAAHEAWYDAHVRPAMPPGAPASQISYLELVHTARAARD